MPKRQPTITTSPKRQYKQKQKSGEHWDRKGKKRRAIVNKIARYGGDVPPGYEERVRNLRTRKLERVREKVSK